MRSVMSPTTTTATRPVAEPVGLVLLDKPEGSTSHDMVSWLRRVLGTRRVGHTGTLDPMATGLLLLCVGWATRLAEYLLQLPKTYRGVVRLGERTDTDDRTGRVLGRDEGWRDLDVDDVRQALGSFTGLIEQRPPSYSAKKVRGERSYAAARRGEPVVPEPVRVQVHRIKLVARDGPDVSLEVECSSGTYIRALARDLGQVLGVGGHLAGLRRMSIGPFRVEDALEPRPSLEASRIREALLPPRLAVAHLPDRELEPDESEAVRHGRSIEWRGGSGEGPVALLAGGRLLAIGERSGGALRPRKVFPRQ